MTTAEKKNKWQTKVPGILGPFFAILGAIALIGNWAITDPTVEKINMVAGAMIFLGLVGLMWVTGLTQKINHLQSQVDKLLENEKHSNPGSNETS